MSAGPRRRARSVRDQHRVDAARRRASVSHADSAGHHRKPPSQQPRFRPELLGDRGLSRQITTRAIVPAATGCLPQRPLALVPADLALQPTVSGRSASARDRRAHRASGTQAGDPARGLAPPDRHHRWRLPIHADGAARRLPWRARHGPDPLVGAVRETPASNLEVARGPERAGRAVEGARSTAPVAPARSGSASPARSRCGWASSSWGQPMSRRRPHERAHEAAAAGWSRMREIGAMREL